MGALLRLVVLLALAFAAAWFLLGEDRPMDGLAQKARRQAGAAAREAKEAVQGLDVETVERDLRQTGRVVRQRSSQAVRALGEATEDVRITAAIEAQLALDPRLSALAIDVNTTDGRVTLAGRVDSPEDVSRAIEIAFRHDDVREVVSTLQVSRPVSDRSPAPR